MDKLLMQSMPSRRKNSPEIYFFFMFILVCIIFLFFSFFLAPESKARAAENTQSFSNTVNIPTNLRDYNANSIAFTPVPIRIQKADVEEVYLSHIGSYVVKDIIKELNIDTTDYKIVPPENEVLLPPYVIKMVKLTTKVASDEKVLAYDTEVVLNNSMYEGQETETQQGQNGLQIFTSKSYYEDGVFVKKEILNSKIVTQPITRIVNRGTKIYFETNGNANLQKWADVIDSTTTDENERIWLKVTMKCESMGREYVTDNTGKFNGLFQFDVTTWTSNCNESPENIFNGKAQINCSLKLYRAGQSKRWPVCGQ